jgi:hypothetical protein
MQALAGVGVLGEGIPTTPCGTNTITKGYILHSHNIYDLRILVRALNAQIRQF